MLFYGKQIVWEYNCTCLQIRLFTQVYLVIKLFLGEFPWQVSLQILTEVSPRHICGCAIINSNWVVTAGHCVHRLTADRLSVVAGDYLLYTVEGKLFKNKKLYTFC